VTRRTEPTGSRHAEVVVKRNTANLALLLAGLFFAVLCAPRLHAQIVNEVRANIDHSFIIGNTTLPPGQYTFRVMPDSDLSIMTVTSQNDKTSVAFIVQNTIDSHTPAHTELIFRKYGNTEFLNKIFELGNKLGAEVTESSHEEARLVKQGQQPTMQTDEQK
jgi:hypothetical protein